MSIVKFINYNKPIFYTKYINNNNKTSLNNFMLTLAESLIINKKMPSGYKLVLDDNDDIKINQSSNELIKKEKIISKLKQKRRINSKKKNSEFKKYFKNIQKEKNSFIQKCKICFDRILSENCSHIFYPLNNNKKIPSLYSIEKKLSYNKYKKYSDFFLDLRNIWNYFFDNYSSEPKIFQSCCLLSKLTEDLYNQFDNIDENENNGFNLNKEINCNLFFNRKITPQIEKKIITIGEKNALGFAIRNLNKEQLKGFVKLLQKFNINEKNYGERKFVEFDIDKLPKNIFLNLKLYVEECGININNIYQYYKICKGNNYNKNNNDNNLKSKISKILKNNLQNKQINSNNENIINSENKNIDLNGIYKKINSNNSNIIEIEKEFKNQNINIYPEIEKLVSSSEEDFSELEIETNN